MNVKHRDILRRHWSSLRRDLEPIKLLPYLVNVLDDQDKEEVKNKSLTRQDRSDILLDILPRRGPNAFDDFVNALQKVQPHLASPLLQEPETMDEKHRNILRYVRTPLVRDMDAMEVLLHMAASQVFSERDEDEIKAMRTRHEKCEMLLDKLPHRGAKAYESFKKALREGSQSFLLNVLVQAEMKELGSELM